MTMDLEKYVAEKQIILNDMLINDATHYLQARKGFTEEYEKLKGETSMVDKAKSYSDLRESHGLRSVTKVAQHFMKGDSLEITDFNGAISCWRAVRPGSYPTKDGQKEPMFVEDWVHKKE